MKMEPFEPRELETMVAYDEAVERVVELLRSNKRVMTTHQIAEHILGCCPKSEECRPLEWLALLAATAFQHLAVTS